MEKEIFVGNMKYKYQGFTQDYVHAMKICEYGGQINSIEEFLNNDIVTIFDKLGAYPVWYFYVKV